MEPFGVGGRTSIGAAEAVPARVPNGGEPLDFLLVVGYGEVRRVARDWRAFSSDTPGRVPIPHEVEARSVRQLPIESDPPLHRSTVSCWCRGSTVSGSPRCVPRCAPRRRS